MVKKIQTDSKVISDEIDNLYRDKHGPAYGLLPEDRKKIADMIEISVHRKVEEILARTTTCTFLD